MSVFQDRNDTIIQRRFFKKRNKAVSDGAISSYLDHFVTTRVSKYTYGSFCAIPYNPSAPDHRSRSRNVFAAVSGDKRIDGFFDIIIPKVSCLTILPQKVWFFKICRVPKFRRQKNSGKLSALLQILQLFSEFLISLFGVTVVISRLQSGKILIPVRSCSSLQFVKASLDVQLIYIADNYYKLCTIEADLSRAPRLLIPKAKKRGGLYYRVDYDIVVLFGATELKAHLAWKEFVSNVIIYLFNLIVVWFFLGKRGTVSFLRKK